MLLDSTCHYLHDSDVCCYVLVFFPMMFISKCFLIQQGIESMLPFISKRKVIITQKDVVILLTRDRPFCNEFSTGTQEQLNTIEGLIL